MTRTEKWDRRFLNLAKEISTWSKDPSTQVGAVIVDSDGIIIATGYNGFPRRLSDAPELYADREKKYKRVVHAELNAILHTAIDIPKFSTLYVTPIPPCTECTKAILTKEGIFRVVIGLGNGTWCAKWDAENKIAEEMMSEAGVHRTVYPLEDSCLLGSNVQPSEFEDIVGNRVTLGDVVCEAQERSTLSVSQWNTLVRDDSDYAEALIQMAVNDLHITPVEK